MILLQNVTLMHPLPGALDTTSIDLFSTALLEGGAGGELLVERAGGTLHPTSLRWWLRQPGQRDPGDFSALQLIEEGPVLDIGCATGRHLQALASAGVPAEGIDVNPAAVAIARLHGCAVQQADFWSFSPDRRYRWLVALGNNLGIAGRLAGLPRFLDRCAGLLANGGHLLVSSIDWRHPAAAPNDGAYPGEMHLRHHYAGLHGPWFDWLYVTPDTLEEHAHTAGFHCEAVHRFADVYVAVLTLVGRRAARAA